MPMMTTRATVIAAIAFTAATAGCGGTAPNRADATTPAPSAGQGQQSPAADDNSAGLRFARCMRGHGVDVPDPAAGQTDVVTFPGDADPTVLAAGQRACAKDLPAQVADGNSADVDRSTLALARCLNAHGASVPEPQPGENVAITPQQAADPSFKAAQTACGMPAGGAPASKAP